MAHRTNIYSRSCLLNLSLLLTLPSSPPPHTHTHRGKFSLETICLVLAYKVKYPENIFLLRGNHECASINRYTPMTSV